MSHSSTPSSTTEVVPPAQLEDGLDICRGQVAGAVAAAALQLVAAGVHEGRVRISPKDAMLAAAAVYQIAYDSRAMHVLMQHAARAAGVEDAYLALPAKLK